MNTNLVEFIYTIFSFRFNPYGMISLVSVIFGLYLLYVLYSQENVQSLTRWLKIIVTISTFWALSETLNRFSANPTAGGFWDSISWPCFIFIGPCCISLITNFIGKEKKLDTFWAQLILFVPPAIFSYISLTSNLLFDRRVEFIRQNYYGQWYSPPGDFFTYIAFPWAIGSALTSVAICFVYIMKTKKDLQRKRAFLLALGIAIPSIVASTTNGIFRIYQIQFLEIGVSALCVMNIIFIYAIVKLQLTTVNPATIARNIVDTMSESLFVFNKKHIIEYVNNAVEYILGYNKLDLEGKNIEVLFGDNWNAFNKIAVEPIEQGIEPMANGVETKLQSKNGEEIPFNFSLSPFKDTNGNILSSIGVASDLRKLQELSIITAERDNLSAVMESIKDGIITLDLDNNISRINTAACFMLHVHQAESVYGQSLSNIFQIEENKSVISIETLLPNRFPSNDITIEKNDINVVLQTGGTFPGNVTISIITAGKHVGLGAIVTINDLTKEKQLDEMKVDFVSMSVHELRTPLTSIKGYLSVFFDENRQKLDTEQIGLLDRVQESTSRLEVLINNLLNVSRIETGSFNINVEKKDVNWGETVNQIVGEVIPRAQAKNIILLANIAENLPTAAIDPVRMGEVLANLLTNALNYTESGGKITVSVYFKDNQIVTSVQDTGRGIPQKALSQLFTKFYRVKESQLQMTSGNGLGLYISKAIVEKHGGKIWVDSEEGKGATFTFSFPIYVQPSVNILHVFNPKNSADQESL